MPVFKVAQETRNGASLHHDTVVQARTLHRPDTPRWIVLARQDLPFLEFSSDPAAGLPLTSPENIAASLRSFNLIVCLTVLLDPASPTLTPSAAPEVLHYFRRADAALKPLPPDPGPIAFAAGDTYIALSPGVRRIAESAAIARFLHLRDDFNAEKLADALLDHLLEFAGTDELPEDISALVIEAR